MSVRDLGHDRKAQARSSRIPGSGLVQSFEAPKDAFPVILGDTIAIILDGQLDEAVARSQADSDLSSSMTRRVIQKVAYQPVQLLAIPRDPTRGHARCVDTDPVLLAEPIDSLQHDVIEIDVLSHGCGTALVHARKEEKILHDSL